jgi:hypothetical protein
MSVTSQGQAAADSVWVNVAKAVKEGKDPQIAISYKMLVPKKKGRPGRPRTRSKERPFATHASSPLFGSKFRPVCANPKCKKRLKANQEIVCCKYCAEEFKLFAETALAILFPVKKKLMFKKPKEVPIVSLSRSITTRP